MDREMPTRAYWTGHLRLSLVTIGIELYPAASSSAAIRLNQIHKPSGKRIRYQKIASGVGPVDLDEVVKGYEVAKDEYVLLEAEELEKIKLESKETIDLVQFVDHCEIDPRYFEKPFYVIPADGAVAAEGFSVIREALRATTKVGLGQMASRGRDHVVAIKPCGQGLLLETLRYADEIKESDRIFDEIPDVRVDSDMQDLAEELIKRRSAPFDPDKFTSQYSAALKELIDQKRKTGKISSTSDEGDRPSGGNVIDLMEALKKSVAGNRKTPPRKATAKKKVAKRKSVKRATG